MAELNLLTDSPVILITAVAVLGLLVGSFLNVVIYRLPVMMQRAWRIECTEYLGLDKDANNLGESFDLIKPNSCCPSCKSPIKPYQNIPVISYIFLKGQCAFCKHPISIRYPLIEAFTALSSAIVAWRFGFTAETGVALLLTWSLIALAFIDIDHQLLPDSITLPLLWLGIFLSLFNFFANSHDSIIGAIAGYLSLWSVYHLFRLLTGKEGMGYGDFKLLALFGAWLGWQALPGIIIISSLVGAVLGISMIVFSKHDRNSPIPFGPYLAVAGWIYLLFGNQINQYYLNFAGL